MKDTFDKLDEAKYFLSQLKKNIINVSIFRYNLSAFLSAIRSVTYFLQKECHNVPGFSEWYTKEQEKMKRDLYMKFLNDKRVLEVHKGRSLLRKETRVTHHDSVSMIDSITIFLIRSDGTGDIRQSGPPVHNIGRQIDPTTEHLWFFEDFEDKDIILLCEEHVAKIETLLNECKIALLNIHP